MDMIVSLPAVGFSRQIKHQISSFRLHHEWAQFSLGATAYTAHCAMGDSSQPECSSSGIGELRCPDDESQPDSSDVVPPKKRRAFYAHKIQNSLQPKGPGSNDCKVLDRTLNILTSLPIIGLGMYTRRRSAAESSKSRYGLSVILVGLAATAYHSSSGRLRTFLRKADYYTISASSVALTNTLHGQKLCSRTGKLATALSLIVMPFKPSLVTACHSAAAEVEFRKQAVRNKALRAHHRRHCGALAAGLSLFAIEDIAIRHNIHVTHSLWHCLALLSTASMTPLIMHNKPLVKPDYKSITP